VPRYLPPAPSPSRFQIPDIKVAARNYHESLEQGSVLEEKAPVWRAPDSYGALVTAVRMVEKSVREHQLKGLLEATHPERSHLTAALSGDLDNAEVAQSAKMLRLGDDRKQAKEAMDYAEHTLLREKMDNQRLRTEIAKAQADLVAAAGMHVESYADLKEESGSSSWSGTPRTRPKGWP
jgi:hypothetical protein